MGNIGLTLLALLFSFLGYAADEEKTRAKPFIPMMQPDRMGDSTESLSHVMPTKSSDALPDDQAQAQKSKRKNTRKGMKVHQWYEPQPSLQLLCDDVLSMIFQNLSPRNQRTLSAVCVRLRSHYCANADRLVLEPLRRRYLNNWTESAVHNAERSMADQWGAFDEYLHRSEVPAYLIDACKRTPLYPLALLRHLSGGGFFSARSEPCMPKGAQFKGRALVALPDGLLASARGNTVILWDSKHGPCQTIRLKACCCGAALAVLSDGRLAVGHCGGVISLLDVKKKSHISMREENDSWIECLMELASGYLALLQKHFVTSKSLRAPTIEIWDTQKGVCVKKHEIYHPFFSLFPNPYGYRRFRSFMFDIRDVAQTIKDIDSNMFCHFNTSSCNAVKSLAELPDGSFVSVASCNFLACECRRCKQQIQGYFLHSRVIALKDRYYTPCLGLGVFSDGRLAFLRSDSLEVFNAGQPLNQQKDVEMRIESSDLNATEFRAMAMLPDGRVAIAGTDKNLKGFIRIVDIYFPVRASLNNIRKRFRNDVVKAHIKQRKPVNALDSEGYSLLHQAVALGDLHLVRELFDKGASPQTENNEGDTPLMCAAEANRWDIATELLEHGADVNTRRKNNDNTPLQLAAYSGRLDIVQGLLARGADINIGSPVAFAVSGGHFNVVKTLLEHGADPDKTRFPETPVEEATREGRSDIVKILLEYGAKSQAASPNQQGFSVSLTERRKSQDT